MKKTKKAMLLGLAIMMAIGVLSTVAHAEEDISRENGLGTLATAQAMFIEAQVKEIKGFEAEAYELDARDGAQRLGLVSGILLEAINISDKVNLYSSFEEIDKATQEVSELHKSACEVVRSKTECF
ncbi:hypothetical protein D3C87_104920 [compost metagenome]